MKSFRLFCLMTVLGLQAHLTHASWREKVIYGDDDRRDLYEVKNPLYVTLARSTAAMIPRRNLAQADRENVIALKGRPLQDQGICADERFVKQIAAAQCSGFLVAPDILVTAGHCIKNVDSCAEISWVFDFKSNLGEERGTNRVKAQNVYNCVEVIEQRMSMSDMDDFAVVRLDRPVTDRAPLKFRREGAIEVGDALVVIGHPSGLPTKVADGAKVRSADQEKFFVANLDTYGGNSGSAVFNQTTGLVEGILVRGEKDYVYDAQKGCRKSNVCADNLCRGEDVTRITHINALKELP